MEISNITSANSMSVMRMTSASLKDQKSKNIQNEIADVQQQIRKLSSTEDMSVNEKASERKKLQKEVSSLNTELKQHQEELLRSHKREIRLAELLEDKNPAKEKAKDNIEAKAASSDTTDPQSRPADEQLTMQPGMVITQNSDGTVILKEIMNPAQSQPTDTEKELADDAKEEALAEKEKESIDEDTNANLTGQQMQAMVSADTLLSQADRQGTLIAKTADGIAILKGEIKQDENRGVDTERKQAELEKMQQQKQREVAFQFSMLGEADDAMRPAAETNGTAKSTTENTLYISGLSVPPETQASQERFYVSIG